MLILSVEIFLAIFLVFLGLSAGFGNALSIYIFGCIKSKRDRSYITKIVFINLAITDLINGFICIPFTITLLLQGRKFAMDSSIREAMCFIVGFTFNVVSRTSLFLIMIMSVDRFLALFYPIHYKSKLNNSINFIRIYVIISWGISVILSLIPIFYGKPYKYNERQLRCTYGISSLKQKMTRNDKILAFILIQMIPFIIPFVIMVTSSVMVYIKIKANIDRRRKQLESISTAQDLNSSSIVKPEDPSSAPTLHGNRNATGHGRVSIVVNDGDVNVTNNTMQENVPECYKGASDMKQQLWDESTGVLSDEDISVETNNSRSTPLTTRSSRHMRCSVSSSTSKQPSTSETYLHGAEEEDVVGNTDKDRIFDSTTPNSWRPSTNQSTASLNTALPPVPPPPKDRPHRLSVLVPEFSFTSNKSTASSRGSFRSQAENLIRRATASKKLGRKECRILKRRKKGAMTVLLMVSLFIICYFTWLLHFLWIFIGLLNRNLNYRKFLNETVTVYMMTMFPVGAFLNSGVNPYIYYSRNSVFKREFQNLKIDLAQGIMSRGRCLFTALRRATPHQVIK